MNIVNVCNLISFDELLDFALLQDLRKFLGLLEILPDFLNLVDDFVTID